MRLFKKRKDESGSERFTERQEAAAKRIALAITARQRIIANYLNGKTSGFSGKVWLRLLIGFCLVFGCYCGYLVVNAIV